MSSNKVQAHGAAVGATGFAGAMDKDNRNTKNVMYCSNCSFHLLLDITESNCTECKEPMKKIGVIEYA